MPISEGLLDNLLHLALPALTLAIGRAAVLGRLTRAAVLDVVQRGFVQFARAKGLAERAVLFRHVLPNAAIPIVTVLGLQIGYMLGGAIVVEMIFTLPGVGRMTLDAVLERNYPVVQSTVLVIGAMFMLVNLATDILYGVDRSAGAQAMTRGRNHARRPGDRRGAGRGRAVRRSAAARQPHRDLQGPGAARPDGRRALRDGRSRPQRAEPRRPRLPRLARAWRWSAALLALLIGGPLGLVAGYAEGLPDQLIMRPLDVLMAFPAILLAIALMSVFGTGAVLVAIALAVVYTPIVARVVRAAVLATKVEVYVDGARALGATVPRLLLTHIVPNAATPVLVQASVLMAIGILIEAALSFLGVGVRPPTPSLGLMLADGRGFMLQAPWMVIFPGLAIMLAVLGFNMLADGLRDWLDPTR